MTSNSGENTFRTPSGYRMTDRAELSDAMEDYLEMIARICSQKTIVRVKELAERLHVSPSSASRMTDHLRERGYVSFDRYAYITLTEKGKAYGAYLIFRHETVLQFLSLLNQSENVLEEAEKIEHALSPSTVENLRALNARLKMNR